MSGPRTRLPRNIPTGTYRRTLLAIRRFRLNLVFGLMLLLYGLMLGRLGQLQIVESGAFRQQVEARRHFKWRFEPTRGRILDRHGHVMAEGKPAVSLGIDPSPMVVRDAPRFAMAVSALLGGTVGAAEIEERIRSARDDATRDGRALPRYLPLRSRLAGALLVDRLLDFAGRTIADKRRLGLYGLVVDPVEGRWYPNGSLAAHVLGRVPIEGAVPEGLEGALDMRLRGRSAHGTTALDGLGRRLARPSDLAHDGVRGEDVTLTIDLVVQHHLETALAATMQKHASLEGCGVVLDARSGEVLALASHPTFDPNRDAPNLNRATQGLYEPGSMFKAFTAAFALAEGVVSPADEIPMPPVVVLDGDPHPIRDDHTIGDGPLRQLLAQSSNTGSAWLGAQLGPARMERWLHHLMPYRFEAGRTSPIAGTGSGLPWEKGWSRPRDARPMTRHETHRAAFGQGIALTPLQMATTFAAFARDDGHTIRPSLVRGRTGYDPRGVRVVGAAGLRAVREGLEDCVATGTARRAFATCAWTAGGKTSTAQQRARADERVASMRPLAIGEAYTANICSFVAYAPASSPELVVLVLCKQVSTDDLYGGDVAGFAVRQVIDRVFTYWGVPPDRDVPEVVPATWSWHRDVP